MDRSRKTKIVCTIGPVVESRDMLEKLIDAGMDVARLNFSHGDHDRHRRIFEDIRELSEEKDRDVAILCDIQGPKIRTGKMVEPFVVNTDDEVRVTTEDIPGTNERFTIHYPQLLTDLEEGDEIFQNDGIVKLRVMERDETDLICTVRSGG